MEHLLKMSKIRDKVIERVINKIKVRSDVGYKKYGVTLHDDNQSLETWLTHIQEELMDAINYIEKPFEPYELSVIVDGVFSNLTGERGEIISLENLH